MRGIGKGMTRSGRLTKLDPGGRLGKSGYQVG